MGETRASDKPTKLWCNRETSHLLGHIAQQLEAAITRGEKDWVTKKLNLLVALHPDENFWQVDRPWSRLC